MSESYTVRECRNHFHVEIGGMELIGGTCQSQEEAEDKARRLNEGEDFDDVLGSIADHITFFGPTPQEDGA